MPRQPESSDDLRERYLVEAGRAYARKYWREFDEAILRALLEHAEPDASE